ncbi:MAG: membrane integrity-associated transporter subunit PqiC [Rhodocyclaceae bacterium]|nr:membrane integrity-associated transporter subunit PqiC [Rhodocyclaceae bacterium]
MIGRRRRARSATLRSLAAAVLAVLAGCGSVGTLPKSLTLHDFGPPGEARYAPAVPLRLLEVRAPSWLGSSGMQYRFADPTDQRRLTYTQNRWVGSPSELIQTAMRRAYDLALPDGGGCLLRVELDEFSQVFDSPTTSHGVIEARALLISPRADALLAETRINVTAGAASPDAGGGAAALREASDRLIDEVARWLGTLDQSAGGSLDARRACR